MSAPSLAAALSPRYIVPMLTIYSTPVSANGRKVLALIHQLGISAEVREVDVYAGQGQAAEYKSLNPFGKVPTLVEDDFVLLESNAILIYLAEVHGACRLSSSNAQTRAQICQWLFWESAHWQPAWTRVMTPLAGHKLRPDLFDAPTAPPDWQHAELVPLLYYLEEQLDSRRWLVGDGLTIADLSVAAMMTYARIGEFPFGDYPNLARWYEQVEALAAWRATACAQWQPPAPSC